MILCMETLKFNGRIGGGGLWFEFAFRRETPPKFRSSREFRKWYTFVDVKSTARDIEKN